MPSGRVPLVSLVRQAISAMAAMAAQGTGWPGPTPVAEPHTGTTAHGRAVPARVPALPMYSDTMHDAIWFDAARRVN